MIFYRIPKDFILEKLRPEHASLILSSMNFQEYDLGIVQNILQIFPSSAVYVKGTEQTGEPVAWALLYHTGTIRMVYTKNAYRQRGLASAAINSLCRKLLNYEKLPILVAVAVKNFTSISVHTKLGFKPISTFKVFDLCQQ